MFWTIVLAALTAIPAVFGIVKLVQSVFSKSPAEKVKDVIADTDKAIEKAKKEGDTSDIEKLFD